MSYLCTKSSNQLQYLVHLTSLVLSYLVWIMLWLLAHIHFLSFFFFCSLKHAFDISRYLVFDNGMEFCQNATWDSNSPLLSTCENLYYQSSFLIFLKPEYQCLLSVMVIHVVNNLTFLTLHFGLLKIHMFLFILFLMTTLMSIFLMCYLFSNIVVDFSNSIKHILKKIH